MCVCFTLFRTEQLLSRTTLLYSIGKRLWTSPDAKINFKSHEYSFIFSQMEVLFFIPIRLENVFRSTFSLAFHPNTYICPLLLEYKLYLFHIWCPSNIHRIFTEFISPMRGVFLFIFLFLSHSLHIFDSYT